MAYASMRIDTPNPALYVGKVVVGRAQGELYRQYYKITKLTSDGVVWARSTEDEMFQRLHILEWWRPLHETEV